MTDQGEENDLLGWEVESVRVLISFPETGGGESPTGFGRSEQEASKITKEKKKGKNNFTTEVKISRSDRSIEYFFECCPHDQGVGVDTRPVIDSNDSLIDEHAKAVNYLASFCPGVSYEMGDRWVGNDVGNHHAGKERVGVEIKPGIEVGKQPD